MSLNYKTLLEVRLLHEYYLINGKGESVFDLADPDKQQQLISDKILNNQYRLLDHWKIAVHEESEKEAEGLGLKMLPTPAGFRILIKVKKESLADGSVTFRPAAVISENARVYIRIEPKSVLAASLAGYPVRSDVSSIFFFSNEDAENEKTFPSLTAPVSPFDQDKMYSQGELAFFPGEGIKRFLHKKDTPAISQWKSIGGNAFVSSGDRLVLPASFNFSFPPGTAAAPATFVLTAPGGGVVDERTIPVTGSSASVRVDYSNLPALKEETYLLQATMGEFSYARSLRLSSRLYRAGDIALIDLGLAATGSAYDLLEADGKLKLRTLPGGTKQPHVIYDINFKSRITYWRYISKDTRPLKPSPEILQFHADDVNGRLVTKEPRPFSYSPYPFIREGSAVTDFLPQPSTVDTLIAEESRMYADILVPATGIFSKGP